jgi:hypothetical protein
MRQFVQAVLAFAAMIFLAAAPARAQVILTQGGGWSVFYFTGVGSDWQDIDGNPLAYDFTVTSPYGETLDITDGYNVGDQFLVSVNGCSCFLTSTPSYNPYVYDKDYYIGSNWAEAYSAPYDTIFSHVSFLLAPGSYEITGFEYSAGVGLENYGGIGSGAISLVPEPSSWALMMIGAAGVGLGLRRRRGLAPAVGA